MLNVQPYNLCIHEKTWTVASQLCRPFHLQKGGKSQEQLEAIHAMQLTATTTIIRPGSHATKNMTMYV